MPVSTSSSPHGKANNNDQLCSAGTSFSDPSTIGMGADSDVVEKPINAISSQMYDHTRDARPSFSQNRINRSFCDNGSENGTTASSSPLSSHYYTQSDTEIEECRRGQRYCGGELMATSCDESEGEHLFQASSRKLRRTQSSSSTLAFSYNTAQIRHTTVNEERRWDRRGGHDRVQHPQIENKKLKQRKSSLYKCYYSKDNKNDIIMTSTPNSRTTRKAIREQEEVKLRKARKRTAYNDNGTGAKTAARFRQQKIADYYRATARRRAQFNNFTTHGKDEDARRARYSVNVLAASVNRITRNNNNNNSTENSDDGKQPFGNSSGNDGEIDVGCGSGEIGRDNLLKYDDPFYHSRRPHHIHLHCRHNHVSHQQQQQRQHKTPITTSVKRYDQQQCQKTPLMLYKNARRKNATAVDAAAAAVDADAVCKTPVLLDIFPHPRISPAPDDGLNENADLVNNNISPTSNSRTKDSAVPLPLPSFPTATPPSLPSSQKCSCCQISSVDSISEKRIHEYRDLGNGYVMSADQYLRNENIQLREDDDETQFMNVSDKIYENLMPTDATKPLVNMVNWFPGSARAMSHVAQSNGLVGSSSSSSSSTNPSNCSSTLSNPSYPPNSFMSPMQQNNEPELYGQLIAAVMRDARQNQWATDAYVSQAIAETQQNIEKFLCADKNDSGVGRLALLPHHTSDPEAPRFLTVDSQTFERDCAALCILVAEKLRRAKTVSLHDYNENIERVQAIISQLKCAMADGNAPAAKSRRRQRQDENRCFLAGNAANGNSGGGALQKFIGKIRSIF